MGEPFLRANSGWSGTESHMTRNWLTSIANTPLSHSREKENHKILGKGTDKEHSFTLELWRRCTVSTSDILFKLLDYD